MRRTSCLDGARCFAVTKQLACPHPTIPGPGCQRGKEKEKRWLHNGCACVSIAGMQDQIYIYAFCDENGVVYVGQTNDLEQRHFAHTRATAGKYAGFQFKTLRECDAKNACRLESQIIKAYWRKGQCKGNRTLPGYNPRKPRKRVWVRCVETGTIYRSVTEAIRHFNRSKYLIWSAIYSSHGKLSGTNFTLRGFYPNDSI